MNSSRRHSRGALAVGLALFATVPVLSGERSAQADDPGPDVAPVAVLAIQTTDAYDQAEALTKALAYVVRNAPGYSLSDGDHSLEVIALNLDCEMPPDAACQTKIADAIEEDSYLWGTIAMDGVRVKGSLHYWVRGKGTKSTKLHYSANLTESADGALRSVARKAAYEVTGGPPPAELLIIAGKINAQVYANGELIGTLEAGRGKFKLPAGSHEITLKAEGHEDLTSPIEAQAGGSIELSLTPVPEKSRGEVDFRKVGGFIGLGMGAAFGVVGLVSHLRVNADREDEAWNAFRQQYPGVDDVCSSARSGAVTTNPQPGALTREEAIALCDRAETFELMQAIFYPLAAVSTGFGLYLLGTAEWGDGETEQGNITISPRVGLHGGDLSVKVRF